MKVAIEIGASDYLMKMSGGNSSTSLSDADFFPLFFSSIFDQCIYTVPKYPLITTGGERECVDI